MLFQLVYVSNRKKECTDLEIDNILASCKKNNPPLDLTGVLLYSNNKFIQLVEGEAKVLTTLYDKIKLDKRHENCILISYGPIKEKSFPSWHMGAKQLKDNNIDFKTDITSDDKTIFHDLLNGKESEGNKVLAFLKKFF